MKRRNLLLAVFLLGLFAACGVFLFRSLVRPRAFGIILFTGEGLVSSKFAAARLYAGGADQPLLIEKLPNVALLTNGANDLAVSDAAAAASALATGHKVNQRALGIDPTGRPLPSIVELARQKGRVVGLITTGSLTDPTPAAFYAHTADDRNREANAAQLIDQGGFNIIFGGGGGDFIPDLKGGRRHDARDLVVEAIQHGSYHVVRTAADLEAIPAWSTPKVLGLFQNDIFGYPDQLGPDSTQPNLGDMVRRAVDILQRNAGGYLLVVDAGLIGHASERNQGERALQELVELDRAIEIALEYAGGDKTLIVAAGTVATGGMALNGYPLRDEHGIALLGINVYGLPSITWATGPNGPPAGDVNGPQPPPSTEPAAFAAAAAANTADDVIGAGCGPGSERLRGFLDNTFVFELINKEL